MEVIFKKNINCYKVSTPNGYKMFSGISYMGDKPIYYCKFEDDLWLECTENHKIYISDTEYKTVDELQVEDYILTSIGRKKLLEKFNTNTIQKVYDLIEVEDGHRYYTNGILSSNCSFVTADETLINSMKIPELKGFDPIFMQGQVRWYLTPTKGNTYILGLDPSLGTGGDMAAIQVFESPSMKQVAEWQHNKTPIQKQIQVLKEITNYLADIVGNNSIYYSVENNTLGEASLVCIADIGEENIPGIFLSEPSKLGTSRSYRKGFTTTNKSKLTACAKLKSLIENDKITINSKNLLSELKTFVSSGASFAAKSGETDDLIMATILVVRMATVLKQYDPALDNQFSDKSEEAMPMPFIMVFR
jgi:hypothetical protein